MDSKGAGEKSEILLLHMIKRETTRMRTVKLLKEEKEKDRKRERLAASGQKKCMLLVPYGYTQI